MTAKTPSPGAGAPQKAAEPANAASDPLVGALVAGKYRVEGLVARGGMGRIYRATQEPLGRSVALKVLDARYVQSDQDPEFQKRFLLEASTCARLTHPNTVKVYDYGRLEGGPPSSQQGTEETYFMVMEFIEGRTLRQTLKENGHLPAGRALRVIREVGRSLREAHRLGMVHRDLKPSNVMLVPSDEGESVKVLDFGIVKVMRDDLADLTVSGRFLGSPRYMSPEVIRHGDVDGRSDVYSAGILLYEMLCGRPPFAGEKSVQTMMAHLNDPVPSIKERTGLDVVVQAEAIARRCLAKDAKDRYQTVDELVATVEQLMRDLGLDAGPGGRASISLSPSHSLSTLDVVPFPASNTATDATPQGGQMQGQPTGTFQGPLLTAPPERDRWRLLSFAGMVLTIAVLLILVLRREMSQPAPAPPPAAVTLPVVAPTPTPPTATAPAAPSEPPRPISASPGPVQSVAQVMLVTTPDAVSVFEGDRLLGVTPLSVDYDAAVIARAPRSLLLRKDGHQNQTVVLGPSLPAPAIQRTLPRVQGHGSARPPTPASLPLDIRTTR